MKKTETSPNNVESRNFFLLRHGERVDKVFGEWLTRCCDEKGNYIRNDLNMPETIPERSLGSVGYRKDPPLTNTGIFQATTLGAAWKNTKTDITHVYCSPSFRCIQTCDAFLKGCSKKDQIKIKVEPGLFEWLAFYGNGKPDWMTIEELIAAGYNIDADYEPFFDKSTLKETDETYEQFYLRKSSVAKNLVNVHSTGNVLLVGHSITLDICSREFSGKEMRPFDEKGPPSYYKIPYCALVQVAQVGNNYWEIVEPPVPPITHSINQRFDYKILLN